jgi:5-methylcytosine-specific restriction endonuclease McrBC regulatory subunit McrC
VRVLDAVGVIATPTLVIDVEPKIPAPHLVFLLERAAVLPRFEADPASLAPASSFFELVVRWYIDRLDRVLEEGLARDYRPQRDEIRAIRGRVSPLATANLYYRGRTSVLAEFEEYDFDTPLNRLLLAGARAVLANPTVAKALRRSARRATAHMDGVGLAQPSDLHSLPDRRTSYYSDAVLLAKHIIRGTGRGLAVGNQKVWTFLIRTPEAVEAGLRSALMLALPPSLHPRKKSLGLEGANMTLNPDLVWGTHSAVADVKYKIAEDQWRRNDLYEIVSFATGFRVIRAAMIDFRNAEGPGLQTLSIGDVKVAHLTWPATHGTAPEAALDHLADQVVQWTSDIDT